MKPKRHNNHILENESNKFFNNNLPLSWFVDKPENDYGIDYITNIVVNNEVTGLYFSVQLKAKETEQNKNSVNIQFKTSTLNFYKSRLEPVLLVAFVKEENQAYWVWFDELDLDESLLLNKESLYIKIPRNNKLTETDWNLIIKKVQKNASIKFLIESFSKLNYENLEKNEIAAWKNYFDGNFNDAIFYFKKSLDENLSDNKPLILQGIAHSLYEMFNYNEALTFINKCIEMEASDDAYLTKACILAEQGISTFNKSKLLNAKGIFKQFIKVEPTQASYHYNYANTLQNLGEYENAIKHFNIAINLNPNYAEAWKNLGSVYYYLRNHDKEIECYDKALAINPKLYQATFSKGVTFSFIYGKLEEGLELILKSIELNEIDLLNTFPRGYYCIAYIYYKLSNLTKSLEYIDKGLDFIPDDNNLINLKLNILEDNLKTKQIENEYFNPFLNILLSLNDKRAIYYIAKNNNLTEEEIFNNLKEKLFLFTSIEIEMLNICKINIEDSIIFLKYFESYNKFRSNYSILSYLENIDSEYYKISDSFFPLLELSGAISFSKAIDYIVNEKNPDSVKVNEIIRISLSNLPLLINILIPESASKLLKEQKVSIFTNLLFEYRLIVLREVSRQCGHLLGLFSLKNIDEDEQIFPEEYFNKITDEVMEITNDKLKLLPND